MRKERRHFHKAALATTPVVAFCSIISFAQAPPAATPDKKAGEFFKNVQVLKDVPEDQLIPAMQFITSSLGVQCEYCHVEKAFDKDDKKPKQTARKMMQMMFAIDTNNFEGQRAVTCYSCHRGSPKPLAIPVIAESQPRLLNEAAQPEQANPPNLPKTDEIVQKYIAALGGVTAISKLSSIAEKGTFQAGGRPVSRRNFQEISRPYCNHHSFSERRQRYRVRRRLRMVQFSRPPSPSHDPCRHRCQPHGC
jgi:hypothetical protein